MSDRSLTGPSILVILGITGDLSQRKVLPALYHLFKDGLVDDQTYIIGTSRHEINSEDVYGKLRDSDDTIDEAVLSRLSGQSRFIQLDPATGDGYDDLNDALNTFESEAGQCLQRLFYLSIPPQIYNQAIDQLGKHNMNQSCRHGSKSRLLVEKPFGYDLASAKDLIEHTARYFDEDQIFRIDHYLAKETAQNILVFRQRNPLFASSWNRQHISRISISATEKIGIEGRANFYDPIGALRDLIQSHLLQLLSLTLMELPATMTSDTIHAAKQQVLTGLLPPPEEEIHNRAIRGQYASYRDEVGKDSNTETYASILLYSSDDNWRDVPLLLTTGKALDDKRTVITIDFAGDDTNQLQFRIQPEEGIQLSFQVKQPGLHSDIETADLDFTYQGISDERPADAYERVLIEAFRGDHLLFATDTEVLAAWELLQPIIDVWGRSAVGLQWYENGTAGPVDGQRLGKSA